MKTRTEGVVVLLIALGALWGAWQVPDPAPGDTWAGMVPFAVSLGLLALSIPLLLSPAGGPGGANMGLPKSATFRVLFLFVVALFYQQALQWFGYLLPSVLVTPVVLLLFGVRKIKSLLLLSLLFPALLHLVFFELLGVFPPQGEVFDLIDWFRE